MYNKMYIKVILILIQIQIHHVVMAATTPNQLLMYALQQMFPIHCPPRRDTVRLHSPAHGFVERYVVLEAQVLSRCSRLQPEQQQPAPARLPSRW